MMDEHRSTLRREVLPPPSTSSAWGLILVAATALSCALAGSLLMVRASAEMARDRSTYYAAPTPTTVHADLVRARDAAPPPEACRGPVYHANGDGKAEAVFELCPPKHGKIKRIVAD